MEVPMEITAESIGAKIDRFASQFGVSSEVMRKIVACESGFHPDAVGDQGESRGLVQINRPAHPSITDEQAFDPDFSLNFLAKNLKDGKGEMWTCYKTHDIAEDRAAD